MCLITSTPDTIFKIFVDGDTIYVTSADLVRVDTSNFSLRCHLSKEMSDILLTHTHPYRPPFPATLICVDTCDARSIAFRETRTATAQHLRGRRWLHISATVHRSLLTDAAFEVKRSNQTFVYICRLIL
jgi:hypothetical protein